MYLLFWYIENWFKAEKFGALTNSIPAQISIRIRSHLACFPFAPIPVADKSRSVRLVQVVFLLIALAPSAWIWFMFTWKYHNHTKHGKNSESLVNHRATCNNTIFECKRLNLNGWFGMICLKKFLKISFQRSNFLSNHQLNENFWI